MMPVGRLVVLRAYPRTELVRIMSFITLPGLFGPLIGPTLGGWLVEYASWHWIFLINLPVGLIGGWAAWRFMPDLRSSGPVRLDVYGFLLFGTAMVLITIALEGLGELRLPHVRVMLLLLGGLACLAAYWLHAVQVEQPLFAPSLFRTRTFAAGILGNLFSRLGSGALPFLTPLLLQVALGFPPAQAGMTMIPLALSAMIAKPLAKPLLDRLGYRRLLLGNTLPARRRHDPLLLLHLAALGRELHAVHRDEHRHPARPRRPPQQRQQLALGGHAAVHEPGRGGGRRPARRLRQARYAQRAGGVPGHLPVRRHPHPAGGGDLLPAAPDSGRAVRRVPGDMEE